MHTLKEYIAEKRKASKVINCHGRIDTYEK